MARQFSARERKEIIQEMGQEELDVLVIGGGITGAGIALDAQTRGLHTGLVEMQDFAAGTSSRSTKLVHGGLRYLKQFEIKLVAEVGKERAIVYENGPHVTTPEWMLLPIYKNGNFGRFSTSLGLHVYDYLAGVKKSERRKMLSFDEVSAKEPLLKREGLLGGGYYVEYRTDDARLTLEVLKEAVERGVKAVNYTKVNSFIYKNGKVVGVEAVDQLTNQSQLIYARKIINATGPWVDTLREKDQSKKGKTLQLTKGIHLVFDRQRFPLKQAIYFDTPDGRMVFAIPREGKTYVGTTDTVYLGDPSHPTMSLEDREYLLQAIAYMFPGLQITESDVESSWAGIRPLISEEGKRPSEISRKDEIWQSESGLITVAGGKLTGYRKMAELVVNLVAELSEKEGWGSYQACKTQKMPISGGHVGGSKNYLSYVRNKSEEGTAHGISLQEAEQLVRMYGSNIDKVYGYLQEIQKSEHEEGLPLLLLVQLLYGLEHEMVVKPADFFIRRTTQLLFSINEVYKWKDGVIQFMAKYFAWSKENIDQFTRELELELHQAVHPTNTK